MESGSMGRTLVISYLGKSGNPADPYAFDAQLSDNGGFTDLPGQATPNQGGRYAGRCSSASRSPACSPAPPSGASRRLGEAVTRPGPVVAAPAGAQRQPRLPTSTWPELAFPAGTTFSGLALQSWGWTYHVPALTVTSIRVIHGKRVTDTRCTRRRTGPTPRTTAPASSPATGRSTAGNPATRGPGRSRPPRPTTEGTPMPAITQTRKEMKAERRPTGLAPDRHRRPVRHRPAVRQRPAPRLRRGRRRRREPPRLAVGE